MDNLPDRPLVLAKLQEVEDVAEEEEGDAHHHAHDAQRIGAWISGKERVSLIEVNRSSERDAEISSYSHS